MEAPHVDDPLAAPAQGLDGSALEDFIDILERHQMECEKTGRYSEAEAARQRLKQLREHQQNRAREELRTQQLAERLNVEEAHMKELQEFNEMWDKNVAEFEQHAISLQQQLAERQMQEQLEYTDKLNRETQPRNPRPSKQLLNLRRIQDTLGKQRQYADAARSKAQADLLERKETELWKNKRDKKINGLLDQHTYKQQLEMAGLMKRIQSGREEQKTARRTELERLLQRYHNVKTQLEAQQHLIRLRAEKYHMPGACLRSSVCSREGGSLGSSRGKRPIALGRLAGTSSITSMDTRPNLASPLGSS
ncbi:Mitogen-activated protein kinase kinase kinase 1 [Perkinsus chesapeaki]|uniref:Mitogen-activated protein kinase kinase kinase 1 n=1 Tax=Perkinsus chesapeaki TaxID=330153 RepID=A0A7J6N4G4_PERCH|nr:Mitogen-activated protein kinase kinase kinase 1 [Perkinsus chesapeaki]